MFMVRCYVSNAIREENVTNDIRAVIAGMGYSFPMEEAVKQYQKTIGLQVHELDQKAFDDQRPFSEMSYLWTRRFGDSGSRWCNFFRLKSKRGYCVARIYDAGRHSPFGESPREDLTKTILIRMSFLTVDDCLDEIDDVLQRLRSRLDYIEQWHEDAGGNKTFSELRRKYTYPAFSDDEFRIARSLNDRRLLNALMTIKSSGGLLRRDFSVKLDRNKDADTILESISRVGLVKSEYVVLCRKTSEQINKAPTRESIMLMGEHGIRCSRCNKLIHEEKIDEFLTTTDIGNKMVDSSYWMTLNLVETLVDFGIGDQNILVNICEGPDEIDAIVSIGDNVMLFELKDSQFSLGHAYPFQSRLSFYDADIGIIWATGGIAPEVKDHFSKVKPDAEIHYIESTEQLLPELYRIIEDVRWKIADKELRPLLPFGMIINNIPQAIVEDLKAVDSVQQQQLEEVTVASSDDKESTQSLSI